jgi:hypothetical protein
MSIENGRPLMTCDADLLKEARLQAHFAVQGLARAARALVAPEADDSHSNLGWADAIHGFVTHPLGAGLRLGLSLPDLTFLLLDHAGERQGEAFSLFGRTDGEARSHLQAMLANAGLDTSRLDEPLPYEMPDYRIAHGAPYGGERLAEGLKCLSNWYANAQMALEKARSELAARGFAAPPPRCWPHHFDLATLVSYPAAVEGGTAYIGAGLSPGDHYYDEPYPRPRSAPRLLPAVGHWHEKDFFGAIAEASKIAARKSPEAELEAFLAVALDAALGASPRRG